MIIEKNGFTLSMPDNVGESQHIIREIFDDNEYERCVSVGDNDIVLDVGANSGVFSAIAARKTSQRVYAIEPLSSNIPFLEENIRLNDLDNIEICKVAIAAKNGKATLLEYADSSCGTFRKFREPIRTEVAKCVSLDWFLKRYRIDRVGFLKMDIEGAEYDILLNLSTRVFARIDKLIVEFHKNCLPEGVTIGDMEALFRQHFPNAHFEDKAGIRCYGAVWR